MDCYAQVLSPRTFECLEDPCSIPFAKNQEGSGCVGVPGRVDGTVIESGDTCRTECKEGSSAAMDSTNPTVIRISRFFIQHKVIQLSQLTLNLCPILSIFLVRFIFV